MEDVPDNSTRFLLIGRRPLPLTSDCRTLLWFRCAHQPGALAGALQPLSKAGLNMTMVVSRPVRRESWAYSFFVEAEGHMDDPRMRGAIENMHGACLPRELKVLGSYELSRGY